jgi:hypothetical protein
MSYVAVSGTLELSDREDTWRDREGDVWSIVDIGTCTLTFGSAAEARAVAAKILKAADAIDALNAEGAS